MQHPLNRHLFIADNINLLRRLDNNTVDLICIDPPFAKNQTFIGSLKPPLNDAERELERETLAAWGIRSPADAVTAGIVAGHPYGVRGVGEVPIVAPMANGIHGGHRPAFAEPAHVPRQGAGGGEGPDRRIAPL